MAAACARSVVWFQSGPAPSGLTKTASARTLFGSRATISASSFRLAFEQGHHVPFPSISDPGNLIAARFGAGAPTATPSTYILDARGRIAWAYFGRTTFSQLEPAVLNVRQSYVVAQQQGLLNRIGNFFGGNPNSEQQVYIAAQQKIQTVARHSSLLAEAERNTRALLDGMLSSLGFKRITVTFAPSP